MSTTPEELRELAQQIDELARASRCYSVAWETVRVLTGHLTLLARVHEMNAEHVALMRAAMRGRSDDCRECGGGPCRRRPRHGDGPNL